MGSANFFEVIKGSATSTRLKNTAVRIQGNTLSLNEGFIKVKDSSYCLFFVLKVLRWVLNLSVALISSFRNQQL